MLLLLRSLTLALLLVLVSTLGLVLCLLRPFHRNNVHYTAKVFGAVAPILGLKVIHRGRRGDGEPVVYVGNHQNNFDLFTHTGSVPKGTVSMGKTSLKWIPFFGQLYWLTGNILIDRGNRSKAVRTLKQAAEKIRGKSLSVWIFPEGTRSRGRGLLPFKTGAFHTAIQAGVPIVPVIASDQQTINLNRRNNGVVIVETLEPICTKGYSKEQVRELAEEVYNRMKQRLEELNCEAMRLAGAKPALA
ncbi:1-acylglycerol-3-phosphate O-acyltransferase [Ferrimonas sediminicola]|uniref:1-acyl-sn-glycerol-3-phosphate acyltransferase n=1 Tax=Ferrimonas sediminicola TaxID=2569538 RepID=A0A4U1BJ30_9GAMM|nr:1-acylglycerol-3-phosphate O-acyltransferase [Ferrimonas sediminicola]TKB51419.1 1-acylglycerol-3-phosphate O-acyltransferase [Ferrimonas sediminicola]